MDMLCSKELIQDYLSRTERDLITRVISGEEVTGISYSRRAYKTHKYVVFNYIYHQRSYYIEISCNIISGYFTTIDNNVCTKQAVYESIFAHDKSYVSLFAREYIMLKLADETNDNIGIASVNDISITDGIYKFVNVIKMLNLKIKFGKFDFSKLWELEKSQNTSSSDTSITWFDLEIDVATPLRLDLAGEISPRIRTCKYPLVVNGCKIVEKLNYPYDEVMWALKSVYSGTILAPTLSHSRVELLREMGVDIDGIIASCVCFISGESQLYMVEFS